MRTVCLIALLLTKWVVTSAQVGAGDPIGTATIVVPSSVGGGDTLGASSLPMCNTALTSCATILPVNLLDFEGRRENAAYVNLDWTTTSEISNAGFWVERSFGNSNNFNRVFFVPALNNTDLQKHYMTPDTNTYTGATYYRLEQMDLDSSGTYSKVIEIDGYASPETLTVYPNPSRGIFQLQYPPSGDGSLYEVNVYDSFGRMLFAGRSMTVDLSRQASGTYFIQVQAGNKPLYSQVLLMK